MRFGFVVANACVLAGIAWMTAFGPGLRAGEVLPARVAHGDVAVLEARAAHAPSARNVTALAAAYLDRDQPGLAAAALANAPREVRLQPEVVHMEARALLRRGQVREALAVAETVEARCNAEPTGDTACPAWLSAKSSRQVAFLREVVAAGIEDLRADPAGTEAAYTRSTGQVRVVAMR
ncbi:hypothetical protein [Chondromyces apiculatus]|uniref:Uncharacterized protein n=1 Tax=Chondromyces apiculatus DSM 436 TaxID=1192034 RepID=A0A017T5K0_9BACT|nr:hypothetical protein [Chondromyces apiculatus]EYF04055.1 Hypothetical protein CAP_4929 [Chondromyces apiculatus DSM 436]